MKFEHTSVWGFDHAIRGMRNPKESWEKSDSVNCMVKKVVYIGKNDLELMQRLIRAGSEHRKFMRQIFVSVDITAPQYWWSEFDTYKVGTVSNSTSKMHKLTSKPITRECFELGEYIPIDIIQYLEFLRRDYIKTEDKETWKKLIVNLPESWLQKRTITMNYENLLGMCSKSQRRHHKLTEWSFDFIAWARNLPYAEELLFLEAEK